MTIAANDNAASELDRLLSYGMRNPEPFQRMLDTSNLWRMPHVYTRVVLRLVQAGLVQVLDVPAIRFAESNGNPNAIS